MDNREKQMRPFGMRDKIGYMFGDFGNDFTFIFATSFLMIFLYKGDLESAAVLSGRCF